MASLRKATVQQWIDAWRSSMPSFDPHHPVRRRPRDVGGRDLPGGNPALHQDTHATPCAFCIAPRLSSMVSRGVVGWRFYYLHFVRAGT
jgi:hypothetical protein